MLVGIGFLGLFTFGRSRGLRACVDLEEPCTGRQTMGQPEGVVVPHVRAPEVS